MIFGPIVTLEMITSARRLRYFVIRVLYAVLLLVLLWLNYLAIYESHRGVPARPTPDRLSIQEVAQFSNQVFSWFSAFQLGAVLLLTPAMFAGSIAQERERRTIEYMFASTLTNSEIVLSKFLSRTLQVASLLLAGLPVLAIAMMLGGIAPEQLLIVFAVTVTTLTATASLSIAVSVWAKRSRDAVVRTYVFIIAILILPPSLWGLSSLLSGGGPVAPVLRFLAACGAYGSLANPFVLLARVRSGAFFSSAAYSPWRAVMPLLVIHIVFAAVALTWSVLSVRRVYRKSVGAADRAPRRGSLRQRWRPRLGNHPMLWKEMFAPSESFRLGWTGRIAVALLLAASVLPGVISLYLGLTNFGSTRYLGEQMAATALGICMVLECAALLVISVRAAGSITAEKERDTWVSLISTPLEPAEIMLSKIAGSIYSARWFLLPVAAWCVMVVLVAPRYLFGAICMVPSFFCIALALSALAVWFSSWCRTSMRAMASVVAVGVVLGGGYLLCCAPLTFGAGNERLIILAPCIPFLLMAPGILSVAVFENPGGWGAEALTVAFACVCGITGYFALGVFLSAINVSGFDLRAGRPSRAKSAVPVRPPAAPLHGLADAGAPTAPRETNERPGDAPANDRHSSPGAAETE